MIDRPSVFNLFLLPSTLSWVPSLKSTHPSTWLTPHGLQDKVLTLQQDLQSPLPHLAEQAASSPGSGLLTMLQMVSALWFFCVLFMLFILCGLSTLFLLLCLENSSSFFKAHLRSHLLEMPSPPFPLSMGCCLHCASTVLSTYQGHVQHPELSTIIIYFFFFKSTEVWALVG